MARKFKKRLAQRKLRVKEKPIFSINLIRKEYIERLNSFRKWLTK